ncbi:uncharacterized protein LOC116943711 isoform X1 [Petromyzon marinus]|uniref:uncharacterized protein LOC116943711 isoform X1 n=1 Tax=Petromyzon marinus TaxID=7757 RepID=UPI003F70CD2D
MEEEKRRRKVEAGKAKLAEFRQRKAKGDVAHPEKEKKKGKKTPLHQHGLATEEHALTADEMEGGMELGVETIVEAGLGEQIPSEEDAPGGLGSVEPETTEDRSSEVPSPPTDRDTDGLMALEITQFEAAIQQRDEIITQLSANLQQALSSRDGVQQETQHLTTHIQSLQQQLQQASEMLRSTRQWSQTQELAQAQQQLSTCQNLLCEKTSELHRLRSRLELAHATRQPGAEGSLGTRPDGLAQEGAADHEVYIPILQKELQESKTIASQLEATISQKEAIILTLQQTLPSKDKAPMSTSTSPTGTERAALCELTEKVGEAERTVTELQREVSSKDLALEDLRMRLSASAEKEQQLSRENVKLLNDLDNLAKKQGHLDGNLTEGAASNWERREGELKTALGEERDRQVAALRSEMQREVERLQAVIEDLTESNRRSHESLLLLEESNGQLSTSLRDSQAELASVQEQLSSVLSESTEMDARYGRELENFRVKLETLENERTEARGRVAELEKLNAELSFGREEAQRALEQIREQQDKDMEGLRLALGLEYKGSIDKLTADIENLSVALSLSAEELRSTKETLERQYIEEMEGLKESLRQEHKENVNKLLADNERLTAELSLGKEVVKSELGNVPTDENDPLGIQDKCNREVENEKDADVQEEKGNLEKLEAELAKLRGDLVHNTRAAQSALEEQRQQHYAEVESLKETLGQQHKGGLDKLLADIQNLTLMLSQHEQEAQSALEKQQQQHLIDKEAQKVTLDQEHKGNIDKLLGDLERLKEELLNNKEEAQCSLEKMKQQHSIEMEGLKETLRQENRVTMDKLQAEVEKLNNERSQSRQEADSRYKQMQQDYSRQVEVLQEQLKEQRMGVQDDACRLEQLLQHHREEVEALKEALRVEHKGAVDKLLTDTETLNAELSLSRQGARGAQEQLQQQQIRHMEEVQSICEQHIKELEILKETTGQEHAVKVDKLTADIEKLGAELSLRREEELHATVELQEQHARELEQLKESLAQENKLNTDQLLAELEKSHGLALKDSQEKQKDLDDLVKQLEEKHRLSLELALKGADNQSKVTNEESKAELESKHAEELAALKEDFREKVEKLIQENKSFELEQLETEEGISGILRELEDCATFQETLEIYGSTCDNVEAPGPTPVPSNSSGKAVANPQESPPKPDDDPASQKQGRQLKQLLSALSRQCIAMKGRVQAATLVAQCRLLQQDAQYQCESEPAPDASPHSVVDGAGTAGAKSSGGGDHTQGQSATTISTAIPTVDEFNALLQEKAALEERVGDLRKTCDLQQEEMVSLKAQAVGDDDEVVEEKKNKKEEVVRKGRGGVAQLNVGSQGDVQTRAVEELDLAGDTGPSPQAALSHVPQKPCLLHKLQKGKDECRFDLKSVDPSPAEMAHGLSNLYSQETKLTTQFPTSLTVTVESRTPNESENPLETAGFTAGDNTILLVGSSQLRGYCEQYPDEGSSSFPAISSSRLFADVCTSPNGPSVWDIQALFNSVDGPSQQQQEDNPSGFDVLLNHATPVDQPVVISKYNVVPGCDSESESTVDPLRSPDMESLDRPLVLTHPSHSEPDGDSLARDFGHWRPEEFAEGFSEMMVTIPLPTGPSVPCAGDSGIDVHTWLYRCRGSRGSGGSGRHRLTAQISLPSPPFAVEQASGVQVSLLKGWATGSPPHHGIDDKATTAPPPAEQEACEDGVQQQQQQHHGQTDSESEQKSKTLLKKQEAELQEQAGRVKVQVQVQQKGQKQQQQRKHHRKQQKKHPGMVLVQHMSVVPEEGQEDQVVQEDVDRRGDGTELPPSGILSELRKILNDGGDHTSDGVWSRSLGEVLRRALQEIHSSATSGEAGTNRAANLDYRALGPHKPAAAEGCSNAAQSWKGQITELLRLLSMLESRTIQKCGEQENLDAELFRSLEAELHSLQVLLDIKDTEVELLQQQVQAWGDQQQSAEVKQKMKKSTFTHFQVSLEDLNASVRGEETAGGNGALLNGDSFALRKQVLQKQDEIVSLQEKIQELQPLGRQVKEMETIFHGLKRQLVQKESAIVSLQSLVCELRLGRRGLEGGCREEPEHGAQDPSDVAHLTLAAGKDPELQCLQSCISEVDHLKERLNSMSRGAETLRSQLSQKEVEAEKFELCVAELETLKQQLDYVARDCDGLKDRLAVKNVEMQTMLIPPVQEAAEGPPGEAIRSYQSLCAQLEWQNTEIRSLRAHIVELEVLRHQFHSLREDYTSLKWQLSQKDDEIDTMEFRIQELQSVYSGFMDESHEQADSLGSGKTSPALPQQTSAAADREPAQHFDTTTTATTGASNPESECPGADAAHSAMWSQTDAAATAEASRPNAAAAAAATAAAFGEDGKGEQRREHGGRTAVQCGAQVDKDDAKRWDMPGSQAALQAAVDVQRASLEEVHALRLALAQKEEELEALRVCMSTLQGAVELAGESGPHSEEDAAEPSDADSDGRQQTQLSKVAKDKAAATMSKNLPSQQLLLAALEGPMPEPVTDTKSDTVCTKAALSVADSGHPIQGQHLHSDTVPPQKHLARGWQKSGPCRGSSPSQGTIPAETRKLSRTETMNKQKPAGRSANIKREPASQTKPSSRVARATPPVAVPCGTCTQLEAERDGLVEALRMEREACQHLRQRLQVLQRERSRPAVGGDSDVAGSVPSWGDRSTSRGDLDVEQRTGSPCELVEGATPGGTDCGDQSKHVEIRREEPDGPSLPVIEDSASGVGTEMQASTCVKAAEKLSLLSGSRTEEGTADTEMTNGNGDIARPSEGSVLVACDGGSSSSRTAGLSSDSTDLTRRHGLLQCACRRLQLVSTTTRDLLAQISIRVISVLDLTRDEELAQLLRRLKELDAEIAHSEADLTWDSQLASGDPLGRVARQLSELYGRVTVLSEEKEALNAVVLELTRLLQQRACTPPPRLAGGPEPAPTWRSDRQPAPPPRRASRGSPATERAMLCVPIGKFQSLHRRFTRAESQRRALLHQKRYLLLVLGSFAGTEQPALALLARPRVELLLIARETAADAATRRRFRVVARAVAATCRLRMLLQKQQRQRGCTAHGWKVDMPVAAFSTPGRHYRGHSLDEVEREHFWNCSPWSSHSVPCAEEHRNPDSFLHDFINKLESIQLRLGPYYTETSSFSRLAKKP